MPPQKPTSHTASSSDDASDPSADLNVEQALHDLEKSLQSLKTRHAQIERDHDRQLDLRQQQHDAQTRLNQSRSKTARADLRREIKRIQTQLEEVELALESQLLSWSGMKDAFWLAVRFGGIGIVIGWLLHSCVA